MSLKETLENTISNNIDVEVTDDGFGIHLGIAEYKSVQRTAGYIEEEMVENMIEFARSMNNGCYDWNMLAEEFLTNKYKKE
jgi:Holliday junction resolvase